MFKKTITAFIIFAFMSLGISKAANAGGPGPWGGAAIGALIGVGIGIIASNSQKQVPPQDTYYQPQQYPQQYQQQYPQQYQQQYPQGYQRVQYQQAEVQKVYSSHPVNVQPQVVQQPQVAYQQPQVVQQKDLLMANHRLTNAVADKDAEIAKLKAQLAKKSSKK